MRQGWLLLSTLIVFLHSTSAAPSSTPEEQSSITKDLDAILQKIKGVEEDLKETVYQDYLAASEKKDELVAAAKDTIKSGLETAKEKYAETVKKFNELREKAQAMLEQERQKLVDDFKAMLEEEKKSQEEAKAKAKEAYEQLAKSVKEAIEQKKNETAEKRKEVENYLREIQKTIEQSRKERAELKKERADQQQKKNSQLADEFKQQKAALENESAELQSLYEDYQAKKVNLQDSIKKAFKGQAAADYAEAVEDYLQDKLEKEIISRGLSKIFSGKTDKVLSKKDETVTVVPVVKESLIDTLTGKSSWETVSFILLALCILLAISFIAIILFQVWSKKKDYERLEGRVECGREVHGGEREALLGQPKKSLQQNSPLPAGNPKSSGIYPKTEDNPTSPTAPEETAGEAEETQQF